MRQLVFARRELLLWHRKSVLVFYVVLDGHGCERFPESGTNNVTTRDMAWLPSSGQIDKTISPENSKVFIHSTLNTFRIL